MMSPVTQTVLELNALSKGITSAFYRAAIADAIDLIEKQQERVILLMDACERAEVWISTVPDGIRMRDVLRKAITDAGGPLPHAAPT